METAVERDIQSPYRIQFSHDNKKWYDLSGRGPDPSFDSLEEAVVYFERLSRSIGPLSYVRLIDAKEQIVRSIDIGGKPMEEVMSIVTESGARRGWREKLGELMGKLDASIAMTVEIIGPLEAEKGVAESEETLADSLNCDLAEAIVKAECLVRQMERILKEF